MKRHLSIGVTILLLAVPAIASTATWQIDPSHSSFQFKIRHMMVSNVRGDFGKMTKGVIFLDDQEVSNIKAEVIIDAASINTGHAKRDEHLRGPDFFDVPRHPTVTFVSKQVTRVGSDKLRATGELTIRGITREIILDVYGLTPEIKDPGGTYRRGLTATSKINRKDFGITWNRVLDTGGVVVGDEVEISVEIEMLRK